MKIFAHSIAASLLTFSVLPVSAGTLNGGEWHSSRCGSQPVAVYPDLSSPESFNKSLESVNAYRKQINVYLDCVIAEGNVDIQLITKSITAAQVAAKAADDKIRADAKAADSKFDGK